MKNIKLPEEWKAEKLENLVSFIRGSEPGSDSYTDDDTYTRFLRVSDISGTSKQKVYTVANNLKLVNKGDLLITLDGTPGIISDQFEGAISSGIRKIDIINDELLQDYLKFYLRSDNVQRIIYKYATGATILHASKSIQYIDVIIPSLQTQKKIVEILEKAEKALEKRKEAINLLDELVKSQFIEMFGDTIINPNAYPIKHLENFAEIVSGITKGRKTSNKQLKEVPYMRVANVKDGYIDWGEVKTIEVTIEEIDRYRLFEDDVLMTEGGDADKLGRGAILYNPPKDCIHQNHIFRVRLNKNSINPIYFSEYLKHPLIKHYFLRCGKQTTGIASINMGQLKKAPILIAPIELQNQFADFVKQTDKLKFEMEESLKELENNFNSLIQSSFKGELVK
ncbi:hypothetical protein DVV81_16420 [Clostridium botulinum]|uniref:restriction endonuclease subunit S n=1 Tax=Clostridium botulinum TaxID=1491 RepID=UPI001967DD74|nr:restriction endonuclease subunit S [Clostridium botulinum]MBN1072737.1 hypothetical protein [Clostridium botulinum]HBJ2623658.1 restriction endonuclease subunit S [Clostridium botulinum]